MALIKSFRDLNIYKTARAETQTIYLHSRNFPAEERYSLTDQIRRPSRAVKAMVAEAWVRRRYRAAFVNKLDEALGEVTETQSWLDDCLDCGYVSVDEYKQMNASWQSIGAMLNKMITRADDFCVKPDN
jgi:four helix bundle protein